MATTDVTFDEDYGNTPTPECHFSISRSDDLFIATEHITVEHSRGWRRYEGGLPDHFARERPAQSASTRPDGHEADPLPDKLPQCGLRERRV